MLSALLLQDLDNLHNVIDTADGVAGTSTGAVIALGLANDNSIQSIIDLYEQQGQAIFTKNPHYHHFSIFHFKPQCKYLNSGLKEIVHGLVGDLPMSASKKKLAVVNSSRLWNGRSWEPAHISNISKNDYKDLKMADAVMASAAAPTFFEPYEIPGLDGSEYFADGAIYANNPSVTAIAEAITGRLVNNIEDFRVLSFGTGESPEGIPPEAFGRRHRPIKWGPLYWLWPKTSNHTPAAALLELAMDASAKAATIQAREMLGPNRFQRANFELSRSFPIDNWECWRDLKAQTEAHMETQAWKDVRDWVGTNWK